MNASVFWYYDLKEKKKVKRLKGISIQIKIIMKQVLELVSKQFCNFILVFDKGILIKNQDAIFKHVHKRNSLCSNQCKSSVIVHNVVK